LNKREKDSKEGEEKMREEELTLRQHPPVSIELPHPVTSASLHPFLRDRFIAGSTNDPWVRVYDLDSGKEKEVYKGHHGPVLCASYSPDGEVYASGSEDGESASIDATETTDLLGQWLMSRNDTIMADESWKELWIMADWRVASRAGEWVKDVENETK
jgi:WD40 repeat protein